MNKGISLSNKDTFQKLQKILLLTSHFPEVAKTLLLTFQNLYAHTLTLEWLSNVARKALSFALPVHS